MISILSSDKDLLTANQELTSIWRSKELFDVTLFLDCKTELRAHRIVLAMHSKMFRRMLGSEFSEENLSSPGTTSKPLLHQKQRASVQANP